ncbi:hypothetical protein LTR53_008888 [Teratosphaeriaceae sp. CCFEE 6253]|nr:hypothetical protein LTR53_008888 [Teratosphaeriaceae sp. CCFEE 6253]
MYAASAIPFKDPFSYDRARQSWGLERQQDPARALTPPPDMNSIPHNTGPTYYEQERADRYGGHRSAQQAHGAQGSYPPQTTAHARIDCHSTACQPGVHPGSPNRGPRQPIFEDALTLSRRSSQANAIAPVFQIPRAVNDSGGSLAQLAAEITCLFWFESADTLQAVEQSSTALSPSRRLAADAKPNTGFRKWVTTILSTTLVAQNVVILALLFIYRLKKLNPTVRGKPGSEYRLLTVALMLGNKFLDDNTYTNKTWADVSGILVGEIHIMEVEFLSNMKYCLYVSADEWDEWQTLLGTFAAFSEQAWKPQPPKRQPPAHVLPPASSLYLPRALPSPPASNYASPPYALDLGSLVPPHGGMGIHGLTPAPSPLAALPAMHTNQCNPRKRSQDDYAAEPAAKRFASTPQRYNSPSTYPTVAQFQPQQSSRLTLPSLAIPASSAPPSTYGSGSNQAQQLPPLNMPMKAMASVYSDTSGHATPSYPTFQTHSQYQSRQHSPYPGSAAASPASAVPHSAISLHPPVQISPNQYLQQRSSPYRPIRNVSTLLHPPPSGALNHRTQNVEHSQMSYQPLGKTVQQRQAGRLPYAAQNDWLQDQQQQQSTTPTPQWPFGMARQQYVPPQR